MRRPRTGLVVRIPAALPMLDQPRMLAPQPQVQVWSLLVVMICPFRSGVPPYVYIIIIHLAHESVNSEGGTSTNEESCKTPHNYAKLNLSPH